MDAHVKNIEAATTDGKYDPAVGLLQVKLKKKLFYVMKTLLLLALLNCSISSLVQNV